MKKSHSASAQFAKKYGAKSTLMPDWIAPELATLSELPPKGEGWIHEEKFDGYRLIIRLEKKSITIFTRNKNIWNEVFPELIKAAAKLPVQSIFLDGEIVVMDGQGKTSFQKLQNTIKHRDATNRVFYAFDCMYVDGFDLRNLPLIHRKEILQKIIKSTKSKILRYSEHFEEPGDRFFEQSCHQKKEGIISKSKMSLYTSRRTRSWMKVKCVGDEEFLIVGFTPHSKVRRSIGALLLGSHEKGKKTVAYRGKVGTGFNDSSRKELFMSLSKLESKKPSVEDLSLVPLSDVTWVKPKKIAQIKFTEKTVDGLLRHPSFVGIREDKSPSQVVDEIPVKKKIYL